MRTIVLRPSTYLVALTLLIVQPVIAAKPTSSRSTSLEPTLSFSADKDSYQLGERVQLSWASEGTRFCSASGDWDGKFSTSGVFRTQPLAGPATYYLKCASKRGGVSATVSVGIVADEPAPLPEAEPAPEPVPKAEPVPLPTVALSAADSQVGSGGRTTLTWTSTDADACTAGGGWNGTFGASGSQEIGPLYSDTTYTLSCTGAGGSAGAAATVAVVQAPSVRLSSSETLVDQGAMVTLSWSADNAYGCQASGGWSGSRGTSGSESVGPLETSTTFTLSCDGYT